MSIVLVLLVIAVIGIVFYFKRSYGSKMPVVKSVTVGSNIVPNLVLDDKNMAVVEVKELPVKTVKKMELVEITDKQTMELINMAVPGLTQLSNAASNIAKSSGVVYQAIIPPGAKLVDSKAMTGAVRGFYRNSSGIGGHANLVQVDGTKAIVANSVAGTMAALSIVVGQYNMTQINKELVRINSELAEMKGIMISEFKSKIMSLVTLVQTVSDYKQEILLDGDQRKTEIQNLSDYEKECTQLIYQANNEIERCLGLETITYDSYYDSMRQIQEWKEMQLVLEQLLQLICELQYALYRGGKSYEHCISNLKKVYSIADKTEDNLINWHKNVQGALNIDPYIGVIKRKGIDKVMHTFSGKYKELDGEAKYWIAYQMEKSETEFIPNDYYSKDISVVAMNNKLYLTQKS